jgi:predicted AlkP superfamily phosphohydrolase/phosphomutase
VGLDGVPYSLLRDLKRKGGIPNMASIFEQGSFNQMSVSIPEISSVSWSSFMTGTQAGEHGIYGFMDLEPGTYRMYFPNFTHLKAPALWDQLASQGKKSVVINMPATYPAGEIDGALVSGFVAIDINKAVRPFSLISKLKQLGYRIDIDIIKARQNHEFLFQDLAETLEGREHAVELLWEEVDWDLFIIVITGTDRLMHFLWDAFEDENHAYHRDFLNYFDRVDQFVGRVYDRFLDLDGLEYGKNHFFMLSDHGFTKIKTEVYLNRWLQENGYLRFRKDPPESVRDIGDGSRAFALDPSRIYINLKNKYPLGTVDSQDYDRLTTELKLGLEELSFQNGKKIVKRVFRSEELYEGPLLQRAPDLVLIPNHGFDLKGKVDTNSLFGRTDLAGMHTQDDAFFFSLDGKQCTSIIAAKEIILRSFYQTSEK